MLRALIDCPAGCGKTVVLYPLVHHCPACGWHANLQKRKSTDADRERKQEWTRFSFEEDRYYAFQVAAMTKHLAATPVLDRIIVAPHGAFGGPLDNRVVYLEGA